jgi:putative DNA primase/helicase
VRRFFELHGESRFTPWGDTVLAGDFRTMNRAGFRRDNSAGESEFYVLPELFKSDICEALDWRFVARVLASRKLLVLDEKGRSTRKVRLPGLGSLRCYHFAAGILAEA